MYTLYPYLSNDGSVGLFSPSDDDIYHSTYGAATEAYEKFIFPSNLEDFFKSNDKIKILDICYGIGYNTKSFLNYFLIHQKNFSEKTSQKFSKNFKKLVEILSPYNEQIYNDNILTSRCNDKIYINNNFKIYIKSIDTDNVLAYLSPFVVSQGKRPPKNYKLPFENQKIEKYLKNSNADITPLIKKLIKYPDELNIILLNKIIENFPDIFQNKDFNSILSDKKYKQYFNANICRLYKFYASQQCKNTTKTYLNTFLHNIYYKYLSKRHKIALNSLFYKNLTFELKIKDARAELLQDKNLYNFIFLDAFTPAKCPCLWTVDFFKMLFEHLDDNGMILTYSNSASIRNAFLNAGFYVGKIFNQSANKFTGTIAVKNKNFIKNELSEYDLGLIKTRAGIFYRDENLNADNGAIISAHKKEVENSKLLSSSKYIKQFKKHLS